MRIYKNTQDRTDKSIYVGDPREIEIPDGYSEMVKIYHVQHVDPDQESYDYKIFDSKNIPTYLRFVSESGRAAFNRGGTVPRTSSIDATTNPDCLIALGETDRLVYFETDPSPPEETTTTEQPD